MTTTRHPRKHTSANRAAQLERLREDREIKRRQRRAARIPSQDARPTEPTDRQIVAEIQRLSMGNTMPSPAQYDYARSRSYPTAERVCELMGMEWREIGIEMGLKPERMRV